MLINTRLEMVAIFLFIASGCAVQKSVVSSNITPNFESASSVEEVRTQIKKLPSEDIWWNVYGEDQAWNFKNLHRFMPTVNVYREGQVRMLKNRPIAAIPDQHVDTPIGAMSFKQFLDNKLSTTMSLVVLHQGDVVFEYYPNQKPYEKPIFWSATKALVATLVGILSDRGQIDISLPISYYLPVLNNSDYSAITVRNLLDMATGIDCPEEYFDKKSCYYQVFDHRWRWVLG
ncbi:MAG: serine hydrolase [Porticoccaceae bacterium]